MKRALLIVLGSWLAACSATRSPDAGSQTHFLDSCSADCAAPYSCICGVCTLECSDDTRCAAQAEAATCLATAADGSASCKQTESSCDVECEQDAECSALGAGFGCAAGRCRADAKPPQSNAGAGAGAGGTAGTGSPAGSGGRAGSAAQAGQGGSSNPDGSICDGSDEIRLAFDVSGGGPLSPSHAFTNPHGHSYLFVDGQCTFYVSGGDYQTGIRTGTLPSNMEQQLAADIHWSELSDLQDSGPINGCPDGSPATISALGLKATCICNDCGIGAPPGKLEAIQRASEWTQMLSDLGSPLPGPVRALAVLDESPRSGDPASWPLSRPITEIPGLVAPAGMQITAASGASFADSLEIDALRALRGPQPSMGFARVWMSVGEPVYELYVRDELPPDVDSAFTEFLK